MAVFKLVAPISLKSLNAAIAISKKFKIKAKNNKSFQALQKEPNFLKLIG